MAHRYLTLTRRGPSVQPCRYGWPPGQSQHPGPQTASFPNHNGGDDGSRHDGDCGCRRATQYTAAGAAVAARVRQCQKQVITVHPFAMLQLI